MLKIAFFVVLASAGLISSVAGAAERIYLGSGVRDNGGASGTGTATSFLCTNWTGASQTIRFVLKQRNGTVLVTGWHAIQSEDTFTASTHGTVAFFEDASLAPGVTIRQGAFEILATSRYVTCTAMVIDAAAVSPIGVDLHLVRFNSWSGTQE